MFGSNRYLSAGLLLVIAFAVPACASHRSSYRYPAAVRGVDQRAFSIGYEQGLRRGEQDARRRRSVEYDRYDEYRSGSAGFRGYGDRNSYRAEFRRGFVAGYNDGYRRLNAGPVRDLRSAYGNVAAENGYRDGYAQGREDARDRDRFDPVRASRYRAGDRGYNSRFGSRDLYKREYRAAFQAGYERGYAESRR
jgi:hypothetical protein